MTRFFRLHTLGIMLLLVGGIFVVGRSALQARMESTNYIIESDVFSSGGTQTGASTNYGLVDTIGEEIILSATSTSANYGIKAGFRELYADQFITFNVPATAVSLGDLSTGAASTATQTFTVATNATNGFSVTVSGSTLSSGASTIAAIGATAAASSPGTAQFGINLVANTGFGASPSGTAPIGSVANQYNQTNAFAFNSGDTIATSTVPINTTTYTISYIANMGSQTGAGTYSTTLTYTATASF